ncbi:2-polyprenyl-6-methoxyphenol hydroxylase-like FAD-dependent oxidoreductase [Kineococcus xinjiangensis]|uniref:2-polyprenyl-6-methoxyphenol hydroxylase-like FAD-dependent oxidoreductase n=1 Tax=Kineococcus xinjiangensis TaxID=512762 RepID=A0A2S6IV40_9ACTN|nr:FAD-dependent oxidoreductase [Kineococcus xinjiangensis]PPK98137.1 2-polyprenyl-6-methoxyphenol hydroxylase-like FAD-dependent oxidoreductase [Kineococcus xinjiangensis]
MLDVLVVGAGPTGLAAAAALARRGVSVGVVEKRTCGWTTSRAAVVHSGTLRVLDALDVTAPLLATGLRVHRFAVRERERDRPLLDVDFGRLDGPHPYALLTPQWRTEEALLARARALGVDVSSGEELLDVRPDGDTVLVTTDRDRLRCRYVVGADGVAGTVREHAGIARPGRRLAESFALADVRLADAGAEPGVALHVSRAGSLVAAALPDGLVRIVAPLAEAPAEPGAAFVQQLLDTRGPREAPRVAEVVWSSRFRVSHGLAETFRRGRIVLVGDAAHVHSPAGGQGMNLGLRDAVSLAEPLAAALAGREAELDAWAASRRRAAARVLRLTRGLTVLGAGTPLARGAAVGALAVAARAGTVRAVAARRLAGLDDPAVAGAPAG